MNTPRIGVYICHCGINIAATVDVKAVAEFASRKPGVVIARDYTYMCSEPGQAMIKKDIAELKLNRVVVASCSPRMHEPTFQAVITEAGLNPYCFEMANIREQCSWVHPLDPQTTSKAIQLVSSAVWKARLLEPLEIRQVQVIPAAAVIGGGMAGMQAALDLAEAGFQVTLVERSHQLGGQVSQLYQTFPTREPASDLVNYLITKVTRHPRITVLTSTEVVKVSGYVGNFRLEVGGLTAGATTETNEFTSQKTTAMINREVMAGVIIIATGFEPFEARRIPELSYGAYPEVITTLDFEQLANQGLKFNGNKPKDVVFIQCVGSRNQVVGNPYCSRVCCMTVARQALLIRERLPDARITVFYIDVRAFGKGFEEFYDSAREAGIIYRRGNPSEILRRGNRVLVRAEDTLLGMDSQGDSGSQQSTLVEVEADLVVLAVGMTSRRDTEALSSLFKLARSADGFFMEAHPKLRPVETAMAGIFLAGCCQGPKDITETIAQARAAASSAMAPLMRGRIQVEAVTSFVDEELCAGCGQCAQVCNFSALSLHPVRGVMTVNQVLCQGCGACAATCPSGAINLHQFTFEQVMAQIETFALFTTPTEQRIAFVSSRNSSFE